MLSQSKNRHVQLAAIYRITTYTYNEVLVNGRNHTSNCLHLYLYRCTYIALIHNVTNTSKCTFVQKQQQSETICFCSKVSRVKSCALPSFNIIKMLFYKTSSYKLYKSLSLAPIVRVRLDKESRVSGENQPLRPGNPTS